MKDMNEMKVLKFGGTSMGSTKTLMAIRGILAENMENNQEMVVVCSALGGVTNALIEVGQLASQSKTEEANKLFETIKNKHHNIARELDVVDLFEIATTALFSELKDVLQGIGLIKELSPRSKAYILSFGERLSIRLLTIYLSVNKLKVQHFDSDFIRTNGVNFEEDTLNWDQSVPQIKEALTKPLTEGITPIITGYWGRNAEGQISLLGRGGSDFSGAILAVSLGIKRLEIWTDVNGFLSADPRIVDQARIIDEIGFQEASELCFFGAKVLHPKTIRPVIERGGEVWIKNTFAPKNVGSKITKLARESHHPVISISSKSIEIFSLDLFASSKIKSQVLKEVFDLTHQLSIHIDMIAVSEAQLSFCLEYSQTLKSEFLERLKNISPFTRKGGKSIVCIVSPKEVKGQIGVAGKIFSSISESGVSVDMYSQNASEIAQLIVVNTIEVENVIRHIHKNLVIG